MSIQKSKFCNSCVASPNHAMSVWKHAISVMQCLHIKSNSCSVCTSQIMRVCVCMCMCMRACVCVCVCMFVTCKDYGWRSDRSFPVSDGFVFVFVFVFFFFQWRSACMHQLPLSKARDQHNRSKSGYVFTTSQLIMQCLYNKSKLCTVFSLTNRTVTVAFMVVNPSCSTILTCWWRNALCK